MKFFLLLLSFFLSQNIQSQTLTGLWQGKLSQESGGVLESYYFELQLLSQNNSIKGLSFIAISTNSQKKGKMRIEGIIKNKVLYFEEFELPRIETELANRSSFCQKKGQLKYSVEGMQKKLEGDWEGRIDNYGKCKPGKISLVQVSSQKPILLNLEVAKQTEKSQNTKKQLKKLVFEGKNIEKGQVIVLEAITFEATKHSIQNTQLADKLLKLMQQNPDLIIQLTGHTDKNPLESHPNYKKIAWQHLVLSQKRVEQLARYLIDGGVARQRIHTLAFGGTQPLSATNSSKNRRVEMKVVEF